MKFKDSGTYEEMFAGYPTKYVVLNSIQLQSFIYWTVPVSELSIKSKDIFLWPFFYTYINKDIWFHKKRDNKKQNQDNKNKTL